MTSDARFEDGRAAHKRVGAWLEGDNAGFRVWAPGHDAVEVAIDGGGEHALAPEGRGYFAAAVPGLGAGARYRFRLDGCEPLYPDPASRFQPEGPHGPSEIVDATSYRWGDAGWPGLRIAGQILYELHVGTFTPEGTWAAAAEKLPHLKDIGVTCVEMMPVADFPGRFGWGYDGVNLFAPTRLYGRPDDLKTFIDAAHRLGLGVILDVVYNHLGPDGNYLACFTPDYFSQTHKTEWGDAINFDGENSGPVRDFFIANAAYWIGEFHFDGLRLDATQSMFDDSPEHVIRVIARTARKAAGERSIILVAENEPQQTCIVRPQDGQGFGLDALWNDDFHHSAMVALTGHNEAYYEDHRGDPQEFISAAKYGYLFQGQVYAHQGKRRGTPGLDLPPAAFATFIQNHDQIANTATGRRFHKLTSPARARAMTALFLLMPGTPMLFQGQEFWSDSPFFYFADHKPDLARLVRNGRTEFLCQFPSIDADPQTRAELADPGAEDTFERSRLNWEDVDRHANVLALHRDLIALRRSDAVLSQQTPGALDGAVLGHDAFVLRYFGGNGDDRLLFVNLGRDLVRRSFPEPLVAPPDGRRWEVAWSSESACYEGNGTRPLETSQGWALPGDATVFFRPAASDRVETGRNHIASNVV